MQLILLCGKVNTPVPLSNQHVVNTIEVVPACGCWLKGVDHIM